MATDLPEALTSRDQWLCWRRQTRNDKQTKVPVNPHTGSFGSATNPDSWGNFPTAREYAIDGAAEGLGFVFTADDPLVGVDLDDCRTPETGALTDDATDVIESLGSYTEISPSGTGVHVLVEGTLPDGRNRREQFEMYESARFFTVTGDHIDGTPLSIEERSGAVTSVYYEYIDGDSASGTAAASTGASPTDGPDSGDEPDGRDGRGETMETQFSDEELIDRAKRAANGEKFTRLWNGNTSGYESHSEADMALCALLAFWAGGDRTQIDRLFRNSGLMREKWDETHYADGSTYGEKTIDRVLAGTDEFYQPRTTSSDGSDTDSGDDTSPSDPETISLQQEIEELTTREERGNVCVLKPTGRFDQPEIPWRDSRVFRRGRRSMSLWMPEFDAAFFEDRLVVWRGEQRADGATERDRFPPEDVLPDRRGRLQGMILSTDRRFRCEVRGIVTERALDRSDCLPEISFLVSPDRDKQRLVEDARATLDGLVRRGRLVGSLLQSGIPVVGVRGSPTL